MDMFGGNMTAPAKREWERRVSLLTKIWRGKWLTDRPFLTLPKLNIRHKELDAPQAKEHRNDLLHHHWHVRKVFSVHESHLQTDAVWLDITADDYYKLYINGKFAAQGPAQNDAGQYYVNRLNVKRFLQPGRNVIAVHVYYQGLINRAYNSGDYRQGCIAELWCGDQLLAATDDTWRAMRFTSNQPGAKYGYDTQFAEWIDARLFDQDWASIDYEDGHWPFACIDANPDYHFVMQPTPVVSVYSVDPESVVKLAKGHYLIDFGQLLTGQFSMKAKGKEGSAVEIRCGEELLPSGDRVMHQTRSGCLYQDKWILSGKEDRFETFDYKGFRYVEVIEEDSGEEAVMPDTFHAVVRHYPFPDDNCLFRCDDERLNRIFDICKNGVKFGSQEHYVDCPTREKGQYLGDNTVIGHSHMLLTGDGRLYRKAIEQFARSADICDGLMAVVPGHLMQEIADYSLQWPMQVMEYYRFTGDLGFVEKMHPYAERLLQHFQKHERSDGLIHLVTDKWNLVDWPRELRDGYDFPLSKPIGPGCHNVLNAFYIGCYQTVMQMRQLLGVHKENRLPLLKESYMQAFYDEEKRLFRDAEGSSHHALHSNVLPLLFQLAPDEAVPEIVRLIKKKRFSCGVYFSYFVLKALAQAGEHALIYELISSDEKRSWGNMLKEGATTCFEAWGKDQKWNTSLCHPWASAPIPILIEEIVGLKPAEPGWKTVSFQPRIPKTWSFFKLQIQVPAGNIRIEYKDGEWKEHFPAGVKTVRGNA